MSSTERATRRLRDLATAVQQEGWRSTLARVRAHYLARTEFALFRWQRGDPLPDAALPAEYTWQEAAPADLEALRGGRSDLPRELFVDRTHGSRRCALVSAGDQPAHIHWLFGPGEYSRCFDLAAGSVEINYIFTFPEHRGRGLLRSALARTIAELSAAGTGTVCTAVSTTNVDCLRGLAGSGLREFARTRSRLSRVPRHAV